MFLILTIDIIYDTIMSLIFEREGIMKLRVKQLRNSLSLSQKDFGEAIGLSNSTVCAIEKGCHQLSERNIAIICDTFNANPEWLRTGKGEMFLTPSKSSIKDLRKEYNLSDIEYELIKSYLDLPVDKRNEFAKILIGMVKK